MSARWSHARVVDEDVQSAELRHRLVDGRRDLVGIGTVGLDRHRGTAVAGDFCGQLLRVSRRCAIGERYGGPVNRQPAHDLRADTA